MRAKGRHRLINEQIKATYPKSAMIHGRLNAARLSLLTEELYDFFQKNPQLLPERFRKDIAASMPEHWPLIAALRACGRASTGTKYEKFIDNGPGIKYAQEGAKLCQGRIQELYGDEIYASDAFAIEDCESLQEPRSLLGYILKHATTLETLRDTRRKTIDLGYLPAWHYANDTDRKQLIGLALTHYELIKSQQGLSQVTLTAGDSTIYEPSQTQCPLVETIRRVDYWNTMPNIMAEQAQYQSDHRAMKTYNATHGEIIKACRKAIYRQIRQGEISGVEELKREDTIDAEAFEAIQRARDQLHMALEDNFQFDHHAIKKLLANRPIKRQSIVARFNPEYLQSNLKKGVIEAYALDIMLQKRGFIGLYSAQSTWSTLLQTTLTKLRKDKSYLAASQKVIRPNSDPLHCQTDMRSLLHSLRMHDYPDTKASASIVSASTSAIDCKCGMESYNIFLALDGQSHFESKYCDTASIIAKAIQSETNWSAELCFSFSQELLRIASYTGTATKTLQVFWLHEDQPLRRLVMLTSNFGKASTRDSEDVVSLRMHLLERSVGDQVRINISQPTLASTRHYGINSKTIHAMKAQCIYLIEQYKLLHALLNDPSHIKHVTTETVRLLGNLPWIAIEPHIDSLLTFSCRDIKIAIKQILHNILVDEGATQDYFKNSKSLSFTFLRQWLNYDKQLLRPSDFDILASQPATKFPTDEPAYRDFVIELFHHAIANDYSIKGITKLVKSAKNLSINIELSVLIDARVLSAAMMLDLAKELDSLSVDEIKSYIYYISLHTKDTALSIWLIEAILPHIKHNTEVAKQCALLTIQMLNGIEEKNGYLPSTYYTVLIEFNNQHYSTLPKAIRQKCNQELRTLLLKNAIPIRIHDHDLCKAAVNDLIKGYLATTNDSDHIPTNMHALLESHWDKIDTPLKHQLIERLCHVKAPKLAWLACHFVLQNRIEAKLTPAVLQRAAQWIAQIDDPALLVLFCDHYSSLMPQQQQILALQLLKKSRIPSTFLPEHKKNEIGISLFIQIDSPSHELLQQAQIALKNTDSADLTFQLLMKFSSLSKITDIFRDIGTLVWRYKPYSADYLTALFKYYHKIEPSFINSYITSTFHDDTLSGHDLFDATMLVYPELSITQKKIILDSLKLSLQTITIKNLTDNTSHSRLLLKLYNQLSNSPADLRDYRNDHRFQTLSLQFGLNMLVSDHTHPQKNIMLKAIQRCQEPENLIKLGKCIMRLHHKRRSFGKSRYFTDYTTHPVLRSIRRGEFDHFQPFKPLVERFNKAWTCVRLCCCQPVHGMEDLPTPDKALAFIKSIAVNSGSLATPSDAISDAHPGAGFAVSAYR